jgi:hypothetical protein
MGNTQRAQARRLAIVKRAWTDPEERTTWISAMVFLIKRQGSYFRWHDSGDVFSQEYFDMILDVVALTPKVRHWLPTKEIGLMVKNRERIDSLPNLIVRISDFMVGIAGRKSRGFHGSSVNAKNAKNSRDCKAHTRDNNCGSCRLCWSAEVQNINYKLH